MAGKVRLVYHYFCNLGYGLGKGGIVGPLAFVFCGNTKKEKTMACSIECTQFDVAMELLIENGFDGIAEAVGMRMNTAMKLERTRHLNAQSPIGRNLETRFG